MTTNIDTNKKTASTPASFNKNSDLEELLSRINNYLQPAEEKQAHQEECKHPIILLVGAPRSGTTLFMQWLNSSKTIAVPSNLISRFYAAPAFGVMLQRLLTDPKYDYRNEFDLANIQDLEFNSEFGKTKGLLGHNSFFYFWRQFFPLAESAPLTKEEIEQVDTAGLKHQLAKFSNEFGMPLAMKAYLVQYNLRLLEKTLDRVLFVHISRDPVSVMESLLKVRKRLYGDKMRWWGCRPPGSELLDSCDPFTQVAGQIEFTERSIQAELAELPEAKYLKISYEQLCKNPESIWDQLQTKIIALSDPSTAASLETNNQYIGPKSFNFSASDKTTDQRYINGLQIAKRMQSQ